jgi:hypothetical protein
MRTLSTILMTLFAFTSCHDIGSDPLPAGPRAETRRTTYGVGEWVTLVLSNDMTPAINLGTCCTNIPYYLDELQDGRWSVHSSYGVPCLLQCPSWLIQVDPQHSHWEEIALNAEEGTYRFRIPYWIGEPMGSSELVSNTFTIH